MRVHRRCPPLTPAVGSLLVGIGLLLVLPNAGRAQDRVEDPVTEDSVTEDSVTEDPVTEDSPTVGSPTGESPEAERSNEELSRIPPPDYLRAFLFDLAALAGGVIWYWLDDRNIFDSDLDSWGQRFSEESYRFDNNEFPINFIGHPLSGAAYYGVPRANRLGVAESFLYALLTSFVWEFFLEFQERFSLNDFVATPLGGVPIGEGIIRLGRWLDNRAHPALAWTLGLPVALMELLDGRYPGLDGPGTADEDPGWANIDVDYGAGAAFPGGDAAGPAFDVQHIGLSASFVALDDYLQPGQSAEGFFDAEVSEIRVEALLSTTGAGFELEADTMVFGVYLRALEMRENLVGVSALLGTSISHFYRFENLTSWHERISYTGFPGIALAIEDHAEHVVVYFDARGQAIFGASNASFELPRWQAQSPGAIPKSILTRHGYWYGWGWLARARLGLRVGPLRLDGLVRFVALDSQEGYDRDEALVTRDADGRGTLIETGLVARLDVGDVFVLRARWNHYEREGRLDDIVSRRTLERLALSVGATF